MALWEDATLAAHRAYARGIQTGNGGNISARVPGEDSIVIKSSGGSFADCTVDGVGWTTIDLDGNTREGLAATREWHLHAALLRALPSVGGIVHCHAPWTVAWAETHDEIPPITWHSRLKFGCAIPVLDIRAPVVPEDAMGRVLSLFEENTELPTFVLRGHGLVALGKNAVIAEHVAEMVEETAQICVLQALLKEKIGGKEV